MWHGKTRTTGKITKKQPESLVNQRIIRQERDNNKLIVQNKRE